MNERKGRADEREKQDDNAMVTIYEVFLRSFILLTFP